MNTIVIGLKKIAPYVAGGLLCYGLGNLRGSAKGFDGGLSLGVAMLLDLADKDYVLFAMPDGTVVYKDKDTIDEWLKAAKEASMRWITTPEAQKEVIDSLGWIRTIALSIVMKK